MNGANRQRKSRRYIWQGCMLLALGSALLLGCKLSVSPWLHSALLLCGGGSLLLGNGLMLYGLLHHADSRKYPDELPPSAQDTGAGDDAAKARREAADPTALPVSKDIPRV